MNLKGLNVLRLDIIDISINNDLHYRLLYVNLKNLEINLLLFVNISSLFNLQPHAKKFYLSLQSSLS